MTVVPPPDVMTERIPAADWAVPKRRLAAVVAGLVLLALSGCGHDMNSSTAALAGSPTTRPVSEGLQPRRAVTSVETLSPIPVGWKPDPLKHSEQHDHQVWLSPTRHTAYGVIEFHNWLMPLASDRKVLDAVIDQMKRTQGDAKLVSVKEDPKLDGLRFVAAGRIYLVRGNLIKQGSRGWVVYAATRRSEPVIPSELTLAEQARDETVVGLPQDAAK